MGYAHVISAVLLRSVAVFVRKNCVQRSKRVYPALRALYGTRVPDFQGLFLRGHGAYDPDRASAALGVVQEDAMRPITGEFGWGNDGLFTYASGAFDLIPNIRNAKASVEAVASTWNRRARLNPSLLGPHYAGTETRPANIAVRYLVRALM